MSRDTSQSGLKWLVIITIPILLVIAQVQSPHKYSPDALHYMSMSGVGVMVSGKILKPIYPYTTRPVVPWLVKTFRKIGIGNADSGFIILSTLSMWLFYVITAFIMIKLGISAAGMAVGLLTLYTPWISYNLINYFLVDQLASVFIALIVLLAVVGKHRYSWPLIGIGVLVKESVLFLSPLGGIVGVIIGLTSYLGIRIVHSGDVTFAMQTPDAAVALSVFGALLFVAAAGIVKYGTKEIKVMSLLLLIGCVSSMLMSVDTGRMIAMVALPVVIGVGYVVGDVI